ncbi:hypothetical protein L211DRAFT_661547 [Terfezia boudieri ATCC MYA-4762]|uniref:Uncharacterized protein n=1 Tax=Terfezia boudieri ATCC MYA-4762 TaxID=1051890 RepID=A0A3N4LVV4_9PEZI|nr:hypothetical protein L211DRAFT_661547 [Terfezia boudieri ATCC MYA-4762]
MFVNYESNNDIGGVLYGFVTTGEDWEMIRYDGNCFLVTKKFTAMFICQWKPYSGEYRD